MRFQEQCWNVEEKINFVIIPGRLLDIIFFYILQTKFALKNAITMKNGTEDKNHSIKLFPRIQQLLLK